VTSDGQVTAGGGTDFGGYPEWLTLAAVEAWCAAVRAAGGTDGTHVTASVSSGSEPAVGRLFRLLAIPAQPAPEGTVP
jgi:hypothetical protein